MTGIARWSIACDHDVILDVDMAGAYMTAMASMDTLDWASGRPTKSLTELCAAPYSYAMVQFRFPAGTKYPCLPMHIGRGSRAFNKTVDGAGLVYLRCVNKQRCTVVTGVELAAARDMGATIDVLVGHAYDARPEPVFAPWLVQLADARKAAKQRGDKFADLLYKLVANGFYGKLGQGLTDKKISKVTDDDLSETVPQGKVTCPHYAATCTAIVRTALITLVESLDRAGAKVLSATTDGCMVSVPADWVHDLPTDPNTEVDDLGRVAPRILDLLTAPVWDVMRLGRQRLGQTNLLTLKQWGDRALTVRTRVNSLWLGDRVVGAAWTGYRGPKDQAGRDMATNFAASDDLKFPLRRAPGPKDVHKGVHYTMRPQLKTFGAAPDWKRDLHGPWADFEAWARARIKSTWLQTERKSRPRTRATPELMVDATFDAVVEATGGPGRRRLAHPLVGPIDAPPRPSVGPSPAAGTDRRPRTRRKR